jgi:Icc protein
MPLHLLPTAWTESSRSTKDGTPILTRRQLLAGLSGGAVLGWGLSSGSSYVPPKPIDLPIPGDWYALVSDTHIAANPAQRMFGQNMADNLRAITSDILAEGDPPSGVFFNGDLALKNGKADDYRTLARLLEPLQKADLPIHLGLGNHDDRTNLRDVLGDALPSGTGLADKQVSVVDVPGLRFLVLDSLETVEATPGRLGPAQLEWLRKDLDARPETPTIVMVHHHLQHRDRPNHIPGLLDTEGLLEVIRPRRQVKAVAFGHTHAWRVWEDEDLHMINLPAVGYRFCRSEPRGWCRLLPEPGGATIEMRCSGRNRQSDHQKIDLVWRSA